MTVRIAVSFLAIFAASLIAARRAATAATAQSGDRGVPREAARSGLHRAELQGSLGSWRREISQGGALLLIASSSQQRMCCIS
jgi:hypothetical protein